MNTNPYASPTTSAATTAEPKHAFARGFRRGLLWSLLLAVPTCFVFYNELTLHRFRYDTVLDAGVTIELSPAASIGAAALAVAMVASSIVLPWALAAGFVARGKTQRQQEMLHPERDHS